MFRLQPANNPAAISSMVSQREYMPVRTCEISFRHVLRFVLIGLVLHLPWSGLAANPDAVTFVNPICEQADPWFTQDGNRYIACFSEGNRAISIHVSDRLTRLGEKRVIWTAPASGMAAREVWAPELHKLDGRWYVYFAASDGDNRNHKAWVLDSAGADPLGPCELHGPLYTGDDPALAKDNHWAIDLTVLNHGSQRYAIWSGWPDERDVQYLYIARMKSPTELAGPRVRLCANDDYLWERVDETPSGRGLNEAPQVLQHDGRTFVTYSCSGSWQPSYKLGMLELRQGGDPMNPADWKKFPAPVFQSTEHTFGVGHNGFLKSPDGTEDWLVYHAKISREHGWQRAVFAQPFQWGADGLPQLGTPVAPGVALALPAGEHVPEITGAKTYAFSHPQPLADWSYFGHHQYMALKDGQLRLGEATGEMLNSFRSGEKVVIAGGRWADFTATVEQQALQASGDIGLLFRVQQPALGFDAQRGYFAGYSPEKSAVIVGRMDGFQWKEIARGIVPFPVPEKMRLTVTAIGPRITVKIEDQTVVTVEDSTYSEGTIGLRVVHTSAAFSRLIIQPEDAAPTTGEATTYTNPVYSGNFPDPSVARFGEYYYAAGTTGTSRTPDGRIFTLLRSSNLVDWDSLGGAMIPPLPEKQREYWAPELATDGRKFYLYYCTGGIKPENFALRVAVSDRPEGPYVDNGGSLLDSDTNHFTIDPFPFRDDDGQWYLFYARNFTDHTSTVHPGTALVVDRLVNMTQLAGDARVVVRAKHDWTLYEARRHMEVYQQTFDWHTIEGPCVVKHEGRYYCFYSGANWQTPRYGVDYVVADHPLGPYSEGGDHARVLSGIPGHVRGPGHHSIVLGPDQRTPYFLYHAWDVGMTKRQLCLDRLQWTPEGPICLPTDMPQPRP